MPDFKSFNAVPWSGAKDTITRAVIEEGITDIGGYAFNECTKLTDVTIPESVTNIGEYAFYGCASLKTVAIPEGVTDIGKYAFYNCSSLTSVAIPEGVTKIAYETFNLCYDLTSVTIPGSVESIERDPFNYCKKLTDITFRGTKAQWGSVTKSASAIPSGVTIHCTDADIPATVTFDLNGGPSALAVPDPMKTDSENKIDMLPTLTPDNSDCGHLVFDGWFTQPVGGEEVKDGHIFDRDQTLYAHWSG